MRTVPARHRHRGCTEHAGIAIRRAARIAPPRSAQECPNPGKIALAFSTTRLNVPTRNFVRAEAAARTCLSEASRLQTPEDIAMRTLLPALAVALLPFALADGERMP